MLDSIIDNTAELDLVSAGIILVSAILIGLIIAFVYKITTKQLTKNFLISLGILPLLVATAIIMINGNLGVSFAVAGIFGLVRFRSIPGNSKEIIATFLTVVVGLALGRGFIGYAAAITIVASLLMIIYNYLPLGGKENERKLKVVIPENLNYLDVFDDVFSKYTVKHELEKVKTTNMGAMYELNYTIELKKDADEKKFLDDIRIRNGNLNIIMAKGGDVEAL